MPNGVLVFAEATEDGKLNPVTAELVGAATRLGGPVTVALLGSGVQGWRSRPARTARRR